MNVALEHFGASLRSLKAARTQLKRALTSRGLPFDALSWDVVDKLDASIATLARRLRDARLARLKGRPA